MRKRTQAREFALQLLYQQEINPAPLDQVLQTFWKEHTEAVEDIRSYTERLVRGTLERVDELDKMIGRYTDNWKLHRMAAVDRNILRFATYEIIYLEDIPTKVAINEAVNIAKKFSQPDSGKFVNGVLDKINHTEAPSKLPHS